MGEEPQSLSFVDIRPDSLTVITKVLCRTLLQLTEMEILLRSQSNSYADLVKNCGHDKTAIKAKLSQYCSDPNEQKAVYFLVDHKSDHNPPVMEEGHKSAHEFVDVDYVLKRVKELDGQH